MIGSGFLRSGRVLGFRYGFDLPLNSFALLLGSGRFFRRRFLGG